MTITSPNRKPAQVETSYPIIQAQMFRDMRTSSPKTGKISAASGVVILGREAVVVADDLNEIGIFSMLNEAPGRTFRVLEGELPTEARALKKAKSDFESVVKIEKSPIFQEGALLLISSGSSAVRCRAVLLQGQDPSKLGARQILDWSGLFARFKTAFPKLNIEGAVVRENTLRFFQRGNGALNVNGYIDVSLTEALSAGLGELPSEAVSFTHQVVNLPSVEGVPMGISDATLLRNGTILFTASTEATQDIIADGKTLGSFIGLMSWSGEVKILGAIQPTMKVEGVDILSETDAELELLLVPDPDDVTAISHFFKARLRL